MARRAASEWSLPVLHLYFVWALVIFDFHFFLAAKIAQPMVYLVYLGFPPLILSMLLRAPTILVTAKRWVWDPPMLTLVILGLVTLPLAANKEFARLSFQSLLIYYAITVGTAVYIKTARQAIPIVMMLVLQFAWYGMFAQTRGLVPWHSTLSNYDGFGGLMVMGAGLCYWFAVGSRNKRLKMFLYALTAYCVLGVVASFARAAFLSLVVLLGWTWVRSPRKLATGLGIFAALILVVVGASLIFDPGFFWNEITSAFAEGTEEGTGAQRWELWKVGFKVWAMSPIFGVGGNNFGAFAATHFEYGQLEAFPNPSFLYGYNLHNAYMQILSEFGLLGICALGFAFWNFSKRNRELRSPEASRIWDATSGGRFELRYLAYGLEAANLANMLGGMFYASLFMPWFYVIWAANTVLWALTRPPAAPQPARGSRRPVHGLPAGVP
ncbi:MAG: O-antigen ligase family protein [Gemmatimonadaceae bacterium]